MTGTQLLIHSLRYRVRTIWLPIILAVFLIGACIPANHPAALQPVQSQTAINRARAGALGKETPKAPVKPHAKPTEVTAK